MNQPLLPTQILTLAVGFAPDLSLRAIACLRYEPGNSKSQAQQLEVIPAGAKGTGAAFSAFAYFLVVLRIRQLAGDQSETAIISGSSNTPASSLYNGFQKKSAWRRRLFGSDATERRFRDNSLRFEKPTSNTPDFNVYWKSGNPIRIRLFKDPGNQKISAELLDDELEVRFLREALTRILTDVQQTQHRYKPSTFIWQGHAVPNQILRLLSSIRDCENFPSLKITVNRREEEPHQFTIHSSSHPIPHLQEADELSIIVEHSTETYFSIFWISWDVLSAPELAKIYPYPDEDFPPDPQQELFKIEFESHSDAAGSTVKIPIGPGFPVELPSGLESCLVFSSLKPFDSTTLADIRRRIDSTLQRQPPPHRSLPGSYSEKYGPHHLDIVPEPLILMARVGHPRIHTSWADLFAENLNLTGLGIESVQMLSMQVKPS